MGKGPGGFLRLENPPDDLREKCKQTERVGGYVDAGDAQNSLLGGGGGSLGLSGYSLGIGSARVSK